MYLLRKLKSFHYTPCEIIIEVYEKTPSNFSIKNKVLAELGIIRPWKRTGDFDNYAKSIADAIQHGILADDCLIYYSRVSRKYSIKPRAVVKITYFNKHPDQILGMKEGDINYGRIFLNY